jgi:hypothetical protein
MAIKIAYIGNFNNNGFNTVRLLRELGYSADLLLLTEISHFLPDSDSFSDNHKEYTKQIDWDNIGWWKISSDKIKKDMADYNFFIGSGWAPAFLSKGGIQLDIFAPHGGDIFRDPFFKYTYKMPKRSDIGYFFTCKAQRKGIKNSKYLFMDRCEIYEGAIQKINIKGKRVFSLVPFLNEKLYHSLEAKEYWNNLSKEYIQVKKLREEFELLIFHQSRHYWKHPNGQVDFAGYKGNDKLIIGFSEFVKKNKSTKACLVLVEYGPHVQHSKELIKLLGVTDSVRWLPLMARKDIMGVISMCDLGAGAFGASSVSYGSAYEFLAMGIPLMHHRTDSLHTNDYPELYPMFNAYTASEICNVLDDLLVNKDNFKKIGTMARVWFKKHGIDIPMSNIINALNG